MYCSNFALKFVSYPFVILAKSAKILPVCFVGVLLGVYKITWVQGALFVVITSGLVVFNLAKIKSEHIEDENPIGLMLVLASLLMDGFLNAETDKFQKAYHRAYAYHSMLYTNLIGLLLNVLLFTYGVHINGDNTLSRVLADPALTKNVLLIGLCGAIGQIFIYLTISLLDCLYLSMFTTSRKCLSVILSSIIF